MNPVCLSCLTGRGGVRIESYSMILSMFQPSRNTTRTRSKRCRISSSAYTGGQKPSGNISNCAHPTLFRLFNFPHTNVTYRFTGSLALSIAYGMQVDTTDNEFFRMFKELSAEAGEAMVLGAFLVDILPPRRCNYLNMAYGRV